MARALSDPLRLEILSLLLAGPATVAELVSTTRSTQPNVSNHLAVLRARGLVRGDRAGRQVRYRLAGPSVGQLVEALAALAGSETGRPPPASPLAEARSCYDHLAGRLGVAVLDALVKEQAVGPAGRGGVVDLGPRADQILDRLGVDGARAARSRRRFAFACLDWTERRAHLGGALGAELFGRFLEAGWVVREPGTRAVLLTPRGRRALRRALRLSID